MSLCIGDRGRADTALRPTGYVRVGGERHAARCQDGWLDAGAEIVVVASNAFGLVVRAGTGEAAPPRTGDVIPSQAERAAVRDEAEHKVCHEPGAAMDGLFALVFEQAHYWLLVLLLAVVVSWWFGGWAGASIAFVILIAVPVLLWLAHLVRWND
ncbi:MAG: NfeD family protein [Planctomycetia bacterium]|nr:NfeD family protein [Planctomycetia bacterium]